MHGINLIITFFLLRLVHFFLWPITIIIFTHIFWFIVRFSLYTCTRNFLYFFHQHFLHVFYTLYFRILSTFHITWTNFFLAHVECTSPMLLWLFYCTLKLFQFLLFAWTNFILRTFAWLIHDSILFLTDLFFVSVCGVCVCNTHTVYIHLNIKSAFTNCSFRNKLMHEYTHLEEHFSTSISMNTQGVLLTLRTFLHTFLNVDGHKSFCTKRQGWNLMKSTINMRMKGNFWHTLF